MPTQLEISLPNLRHNYTYLRSRIPSHVKMMGVVKAFGYGSDAAEIALELQRLGADYLAVAYAPEGAQLRDAGVRLPILVLHPQPEHFDLLVESCLEPGLYSRKVFEGFCAFAKAQSQKNYPVHLNFNTGLNRLGFQAQDVPWLLEKLDHTDSIKIASVFSHLAASEDMNEAAFTRKQIKTFKDISTALCTQLSYTPFLHQSNTSAILNFPEAHWDMVRTGIGLYGYGNAPEEDLHLRPVATLKSVISQLLTVASGESVGYNRAFIAQKRERIATIPIGHADGISRQYGQGKGWVTIHGKKAPIVGNVCMDMLMVNVTHIACNEGDEVIFFGGSESAATLSENAQSISYELLTAVSQRVKRIIYR